MSEGLLKASFTVLKSNTNKGQKYCPVAFPAVAVYILPINQKKKCKVQNHALSGTKEYVSNPLEVYHSVEVSFKFQVLGSSFFYSGH